MSSLQLKRLCFWSTKSVYSAKPIVVVNFFHHRRTHRPAASARDTNPANLVKTSLILKRCRAHLLHIATNTASVGLTTTRFALLRNTRFTASTRSKPLTISACPLTFWKKFKLHHAFVPKFILKLSRNHNNLLVFPTKRLHESYSWAACH